MLAGKTLGDGGAGHAIGELNIHKRHFCLLCKLKRFVQRSGRADDGVTEILDDGFEIERDQQFVFDNKNIHAVLPISLECMPA